MATFDESDLEQAVDELSMLEYFPQNPGAQAATQRLLAKMCPSREALLWLVSTMVNRVGKWHGPSELRGVLCWKYPPADGISGDCSIAGFRPSDGEELSLNAHEQLKGGGYLGAGEDRAPGKLSPAGNTLKKLLSAGGKR